jgi:hypothetical protein
MHPNNRNVASEPSAIVNTLPKTEMMRYARTHGYIFGATKLFKICDTFRLRQKPINFRLQKIETPFTFLF